MGNRVKGIILTDDAGNVRPLTPDDVAAELRELVGQQLPGGCDDCTSTHEYVEDTEGIFDILVQHEETCPTLRALDSEH
jgi:hypothetical protein